MNFYSQNIIQKMKSTQAIGDFYENVFTMSCKYSNTVVSPSYILALLHDKSNAIAFRCIDTEFNIQNCPSILIYHKMYDELTHEHVYYILMICTKQKFKNMGYASGLLDDFIEHIRHTHVDESRCKIVLSSIESAVTFYEEYGFKWMRTSLSDHPQLMNFERYEEDKEYFILELSVK